jgi:hypothetical protein
MAAQLAAAQPGKLPTTLPESASADVGQHGWTAGVAGRVDEQLSRLRRAHDQGLLAEGS